MSQPQAFQTKITSEYKVFDLHLKETFQYRDLIFPFVRRDFTALYMQTILGPAWAIVQPLMTTVVFAIIFGGLAKLTTADVPGDYVVPGFLFYMIGNICWGYFSITLQSTSNTFLSNRDTMLVSLFFASTFSPPWKILLTMVEKNCLPFKENFAYRTEEKSA